MAKTETKPKELITFKTMEQASGTARGIVRMPEKEKYATWITIGVGIVIAIVIGFIAIDWLRTAPPLSMPELANVKSDDLATIEKMIEHYTTVNGLAVERATSLFDLIVVKSLLPIFTALIGYLFGIQRVTQPSSGEGK
jgi:hypothetical protein